MDEHMFSSAPRLPGASVDDAVGLAEALLDEMTQSECDWRTVEHLADSLARLAAGAGPDRPSDDGQE